MLYQAEPLPDFATGAGGTVGRPSRRKDALPEDYNTRVVQGCAPVRAIFYTLPDICGRMVVRGGPPLSVRVSFG